MESKLGYSVTTLAYVLIFFFSIPVIYQYVILDRWQLIIPHLGNLLGKRILMLSHILLGIVSMLLYPLQIAIARHYPLAHYTLGIYLTVLTGLTALLGLAYIYMYRTIGGLFMDVSFGVGGFLLLVFSVIVPISGYYYQTIRRSSSLEYRSSLDFMEEVGMPDSSGLLFPRHDQAKSRHLLVINLYGALIYSSLFYRHLYLLATVCGYLPPTDALNYTRWLDRLFQVIYYVLPLVVITVYSYVSNKGKLVIKGFLGVYFVGMVFLQITLLVIELFNDYHA